MKTSSLNYMSTKPAKKDSARWAGPLLIGLYASVLLAPLALLVVLRPPTDHGFVYTVGKNLALVGFTILAMQFVLSARLKWVERSFGLDILFRFHKSMALLAVLLLISHPLLMALGSNKWSLLFAVKISWHIWAGRAALLILLVHIFLAVFRLVLRLEYQRWQVIHNLLAALVLPLGFVHSWNAGGDLSGDQEISPLRFLWLVLLALAGAAYLWHRVVRPLKLRRRTYHVTDVLKETKDVWTIKLTPPMEGAMATCLDNSISLPSATMVVCPRKNIILLFRRAPLIRALSAAPSSDQAILPGRLAKPSPAIGCWFKVPSAGSLMYCIRKNGTWFLLRVASGLRR